MRLWVSGPAGYGNDRSRTSVEIDGQVENVVNDPNYSVTNSETKQPEFRVHRFGRAWTLRDVETHAARVVRRCLTCSLRRVR